VTPDSAFALANPLALVGWIALLAAPRARLVNWWICGVGLPAALSLAYAVALALGLLGGASGGFGSLAGVGALFANPWVLLAGWLHYLAFDMALGAWMARRATAEGLPRWLLFAALPPTFLAGPIGFLVFLGLRAGLRR
jgi:hypothetical protein